VRERAAPRAGYSREVPVPEFVLTLREKIGHDLLWLPAVSAVVLDEAGHILLNRRADNGRWAVVSGILEPGEEPAYAVTREVAEETGLSVRVMALTSVSPTDVVEYPNGDAAQYLDLCFWCRAIGGDPHVADDESTEVGWFSPFDLPEPMNPSSVPRIQRALAYMAAVDRGEPVRPYYAR
jgi:ADP-ribose pyrophosphatase YjhB (NUDIX family)